MSKMVNLRKMSPKLRRLYRQRMILQRWYVEAVRRGQPDYLFSEAEEMISDLTEQIDQLEAITN